MAERLLEGRLALVTGAGRGIGAAIALALAADGAAVLATDIDGAAADATAAAIGATGDNAMSHALDVSDRTACAAVAAEVEKTAGDIAILVNNAGVLLRAALDDPAAEASWARTMAVNLEGPHNMVRAFLPALRRTRGAIVNVASIQSVVAIRNSIAYNAAKGGLAQMTRALALELGPDGVRVNAVAPGVTDTALTNASAVVERYRGRIALGRAARPEEIASVVAFLASERASYVTGALVPVDGGFTAA